MKKAISLMSAFGMIAALLAPSGVAINAVNGKSREDVFNGFVGSKEFGDICASYDVVRG